MKNSAKEKTQNSKSGKKNAVLIIAAVIAVIIAVVLFILLGGKNSETDDGLVKGNHMIYTETGETVTGIADHSDEDITMTANTSIPGYDVFYYKSGTKEQDNDCFALDDKHTLNGAEIQLSIEVE